MEMALGATEWAATKKPGLETAYNGRIMDFIDLIEAVMAFSFLALRLRSKG